MKSKFVILTYTGGSGIISWRGLLSSEMMLDPFLPESPLYSISDFLVVEGIKH